MSQKLILPINKTKLTASWKTSAYYKKFGFDHYGVDMVSTAGTRLVYAQGDGIVVAAGRDIVVGNVIAVLYLDCVNRRTGAVRDIIIRYYHFDSRNVQKWQNVNKDTVLGQYGSTGMVGTGKHLHIEVDTDIAWPTYSPTVKSSNLIKGWAAPNYAHDKTMSNPIEWLHCKTSKPDYQTWTTENDIYIRSEDKAIANIQ